MKNYRIIFIIIIYLSLSSCIEEYNAEVHDYEDILVVQGMITNQEGPYDIVLNRSIGLSERINYTYESDAILTITDNNGYEETLTEIYPGHYQTNKDGIKGVIGNEYILNIITSDGNIYESDPVTLYDSPGINNVSLSPKEIYSFEDKKYLQGVEIIAETEKWDEGKNFYLKWEYKEIWQTKSKWVPIDSSGLSQNCWQISNSNNTIIENTSSQTNNKLRKSITYIDENSSKPYYGYDIVINQFSLNESTYYFWKSVKESSEDNGDIFDNIPYSPISNLNCTNNSNIKVLGFFDACNVSTKIFHFQAPIFDIEFADINSTCIAETVTPDDYFAFYLDWTYILYIPPSFKSVTFTAQRFCIDCMEYSTTNKKPDILDLKMNK